MEVVFIVLMILALVGLGYNNYGVLQPGQSPNHVVFGSFFLLWVCVAILGWVVFHGVSIPTH